MFIVGIIAKALIGRGMTAQKAGPLSWGITIVGAALLAFAGWQLVKHSIIKTHDTEQRAKNAERQLERTNMADEVDAGLERRDQDADARLEKGMDNAIAKDPAHGTTVTGPVSNAVADELRENRRKREQPPAR